MDTFLQVGQEVLRIFQAVYTDWQNIRGQLLLLDGISFKDNISDIEDQLDDLALADFVYKVDSRYWKQYPRFLQALLIRLERLTQSRASDTQAVYTLDEHMERLADVLFDPDFAEYRWALEEYRINVFAQPMKTLYPISSQRLHKIWDKIQNTRSR